MRDYEEIRRLRIEGHTDSRGSDSYNLQLSKERAIAADRLTSEGYGETQPVDEAKTDDAYSQNRRVDFFIEEWRD